MAEKRRGLGRGLGSLIPSQETGRPSDVFFPRGERSEDVAQQDAAEAVETKSSDPAESMRRAQASRRSTTTRSAAQKQSATKTAPAKKTPAKSAGTTSTAAKSTGSTSSSTKTSRSKAAGTKTSASATSAGTATGKKSATTRATSSSKSSPASAKKAATSTKASTQTSTSQAADAQGAKPASTTGAVESVDSTAAMTEIDATIDQKPTEHTDRAQDSNDESIAATEAVDAAGATPRPAGPVDDAVDESRDGIYVSRETVRAQRSDREAKPEDSGAAEHEVTGESVEADSEPLSTSGVDNSTSEQSEPTDADSVDTHADEADANIDESESDAAAEDDDDLVPVPGTTFGEIDLDLIRPNPRQPRDVFDEDALDELITSIREIGVLQPVVVRRRPDLPGHYELIMGERRFRASKEAGKTSIPAIVRATADDDLLRDALLENLHRVDLNPLEEAAAYSQLLEDFNCTQEELSERIGRSRPQISNTIRLLKLPAMVQRRVAAGVLSSGHARALLGLNDGADMEQLAQRVVAEGLSVRATEEAVILLNRGDRLTVSRGTRQADPELAELARNLGDRLDTRVNVVMGKRKGKLSVEFANGEDLARILNLLGLESPDA